MPPPFLLLLSAPVGSACCRFKFASEPTEFFISDIIFFSSRCSIGFFFYILYLSFCFIHFFLLIQSHKRCFEGLVLSFHDHFSFFSD